MNYDGYTGFEIASPNMIEVFNQMYAIADHDQPFIMFGPSGSGKEYLARYYYTQCMKHRKKKGPFVSLNCAGLTKDLAQSELFGHVKGAFTGADEERQGLWSKAENGVLFLDEIGDLDIEVQNSLLRAFQGELRKVGDTETDEVKDTIVIGATDKGKESLTPPLLYRFKFQITIPGLNDRLGDIYNATKHFTKKGIAKRRDYKSVLALILNKEESHMNKSSLNHRNVDLFTSKLAKQLKPSIESRDWPGNFRALRTAIDSGIIRAKEMESDSTFMKDVNKYFDIHVGDYSSSPRVSPTQEISYTTGAEGAENNKWSELIKQIFPNVNKVQKAHMVSFFADNESTRFDCEDFMQRLGSEISRRTCQIRLKDLVNNKVLVRSGSGTKFEYQVNKQYLEADPKLSFPSILPVPKPERPNPWQGKIYEASEIVEGGNGLYISYDRPDERETFLLHLGEELNKTNSVLFYSLRENSFEDLVHTCLDNLVDSDQEGWFNKVDYPNMPFHEKMIGISGYINQFNTKNGHTILILDGLDRLKTNEANTIIDQLLNYWYPLRFIFGTDKQTYEQNASGETELMELTLEQLS